MKNILLLLFVLSSLSINAQNSLQGEVLDDEHQPVFFATIALYDTKDSSIVRTASTSELGNFVLSDLSEGSYFIEATMLGYIKAVETNIRIPNSSNREFDLVLRTDANILETVEIKSRRPLLEQHADKLVVNVAENITSLNSNLLDVLKKVPGVIVAGDRISLAGATNITILINGKTTKYMDVESLMKDMPGDNIMKVEIIHQPGAEFDAAGSGPIINIILKKNSLFGTSGSVNAGISKAELYQYKTGINLSHYQGSVNINGGFGYRNAGYTSLLNVSRIVKDDSYNQVGENTDKADSYRANLSLDWDINNRHRIGFQSQYTDYFYNDKILNKTNINFKSVDIEDLIIHTNNNKDGTWKFRSINPYYTFEIDTSGQQLDFDFNYITFSRTSENILEPFNIKSGEQYINQKYNQPGLTNIYVAKLDYTYPFSNALNLKIGTKYSLADLDNDLQAKKKLGEVWLNNVSQSNHFILDETIIAGYGKLSYKKDKWAGTAGLRYEDSRTNGMSVGIDTTLSRTVNKLFPSASLSRDITKSLAAIVSYSYRLDRPKYSTLNPFKYSLDSYTSQRGNPDLRPEFTNSMKFSLAYNNQPFFNIEYKTSKDAMVDVLEQDDETGEAFKTTANLASRKGLNINIGFPLDFIPHISGYGYLAANRTSYNSPYLGSIYTQSSWDFTFYSAINFTLPGNINTEISGWYNSGGLQGMLLGEWMYGTSIGFSKRFLDEKLKISVGVDNPFNRFYYGHVDYSNINSTINSTWDAPVYNMQVHYKFGNQHFRDKKKHKSSASEELNRTGKK